MASSKRKKNRSKTVKKKKKSSSTRKKLCGGFYNNNYDYYYESNSNEYENNSNDYCMYIFGNPHDKLDKIERDQETFSHTNAAEQRKKMEEDKYLVLCLWGGFIPYFSIKKIEEMDNYNINR